MEFECGTNSERCSCGLNNENCDSSINPEIKMINLTQQIPATTTMNDNTIHVEDVYNCLDLERTELEIHSIVDESRDSTFHFEIIGKDKDHHTISYRYKFTSEEVDNRHLSASTHEIHKSISFTTHEENGRTYNIEWEYNMPNIICWLTEELTAIKIDLLYNDDISFAFTYIYNEDILNKRNARNADRYVLTAKNNWNIGNGTTYLENGYIWFTYHYNISLFNPLTGAPSSDPTMDPTAIPTTKTIIVVEPEPSKTPPTSAISPTESDNESSNNSDSEENESPESESDENIIARVPTPSTTEEPAEGQVDENEDTENEGGENNVNKENIVTNVDDSSDGHLKIILFGVASAAVLAMICCIIGCIMWNRKKKSKEGMEAAYASAGGLDSDDEQDQGKGIMIMRGKHGNEADIDHTDDDEDDIAPANIDGNGVNLSDVASGNDGDNQFIEDRRIGSGIIDEDDLMDQNEYDQLKMDANMNDKNKRESQSSLIKKYSKRDPSEIIAPAKFAMLHDGNGRNGRSGRNGHHAANIQKINDEEPSESGIGYIQKSNRIADDVSDTNEESLIARDRDISMDDEYHHVITEQPEISVIEDEDLMDRIDGHQRRESISISSTNDLNKNESKNIPFMDDNATQYNTMVVRRSMSSGDDNDDDGPISPPADPNESIPKPAISPSPQRLPIPAPYHNKKGSRSVTYSKTNTKSNTKSKTKSKTTNKSQRTTGHASNNASNTSLGFEPGSILDHYVQQVLLLNTK